jgi:hypothetical protein
MSQKATAVELKALQKEGVTLDARMTKMFARHFASYGTGTATRRRTTSFNAAYGQLNDRLQWIRSELRKNGLNLS